ncbi:MAG: site-specific DNA-methyltransferase [Treponema sp.]|jgi:adenine-specific DNA-methyltransferase|nr:site-specific DNA-methyltransferase [Treponema sp.]
MANGKDALMPTLQWMGREEDLEAAARAEYRLLLEEERFSYGDPGTGNLIVQGDNLEALEALLPFYAGKVKCIYIDPPYNTSGEFKRYDDNKEHTRWLSMMYLRLETLKQFLREDGALFIQLDDNEQAYIKVICDEIFGRNNFVAHILWHKKRGKDNASRYFSIMHDHIICYAKRAQSLYINRIVLDENTRSVYKNPDNDKRGVYRLQGLCTRKQCCFEFEYTMHDGKKFSRRLWLLSHDTMKRLEAENRLVVKGDILYRKLFLKESARSIPETMWIGLSNNADARDELKALFGNDTLCDTPKPEYLLKRIIEVSTAPGDYVLDSFLGSGTTAAVAHKMGRRYIGVEIGEQAKTLCAARLKRVIDGEQGGISQAVGWTGGGGFRFFTLGGDVVDNKQRLKRDIAFEHRAAPLYAAETKTPLNRRVCREHDAQ